MAEILPCKLIAQVSFKAGGDVYHELWANKPHHLPNAVPSKIQACEILQGEHGESDSLLQWNYELDGVEQISKTVRQINDEKKEIVYSIIEGDLLTLYKTMIVTCHVEVKGSIEFVIWTIDYELIKPDNQHPVSLLNFCIKLTEDIEAHISK